MLKSMRIVLVTTSTAVNIWASDDSCPLSTSNEPTQPHESVKVGEPWNTQAYLEDMLRKRGVLKPGEHLAPHEVWELADLLKARVNERRRLQSH